MNMEFSEQVLAAIPRETVTVPSSDGVHDLSGVVYHPPAAPVGIFQISHGMTEHMARYDRFMRELAASGWLACGYDHLGHGHTAADPADLGFIASRGGDDLLLRDVAIFAEAMGTRFGADLPLVLMGHSMGSFIARLATEKYVKPHKLIIMGTGGPNPVAGLGLCVVAMVKAFRGERHISPFVESLAFGGYNKRFGEDAHPKAWLSKDPAVREAYMEDPFCTFHFTVSAMGDLIRMNRDCNRPAWFRSIPDGLPILLVSGGNDPVGDYGDGVLKVRNLLVKEGKNVTCRLYGGFRHEILNDASHPRVVADILSFLGTDQPTEKETQS